MAIYIFKTSFTTILFCVLTVMFTLEWQTGRQILHQPITSKPKYAHDREDFEQQESFGTIRNFSGSSSPRNLSTFVVQRLSISNTSRNHTDYKVSLSEIHNISKPDTVSSQETIKVVSTNSSTEKEKCGPPKNNVLFFKTHKCSSSTLQNILMRYGDLHNLDFVLPPKGNYLSHGDFTSKVILKFPVEEYNIFCHHTRFNFKGMSQVMPKNTVWTTILREPVRMFESSFSYWNLASAFHLKNPDPLATFSEDPEHFVKKYGNLEKGRDPMLYDLGLSNSDKGNIRATEEMISYLDNIFDLVLITEYFEESLILLRDLLCWQTDDIVFFAINARSKSNIQNVSGDVSDRLRQWNIGDVMLYNHFNETFWKKVKAYGLEKMRKEVIFLRARNRELRDKCIIDPKKTMSQGGVWNPSGIQIQGYVLKKEAKNDVLCQGLAKAELPFTNHLVQKQKKKYGMF